MDTTELQARLRTWHEAAWSLAAVAIALDEGAHARLRDVAEEVMTALGMPRGPGRLDLLAGTRPDQVAAQASATLYQTSSLLRRPDAPWSDLPDDVLLAQDRTSARQVQMFRESAYPELPELAARMRRPDARMLEVGTGVGGLAIAFAESHPELRVVALDTDPRMLRLAEARRASSPAGDRVLLREADVSQLDEHGVYDLVWLPAPFLPPDPLAAAIHGTAKALKPGGWSVLSHLKLDGAPLSNALGRFELELLGGTVVEADEARALLAQAGLVNLHILTTPPGCSGLVAGQAKAA
jgi:predicted O-methyltransferase YrrM